LKRHIQLVSNNCSPRYGSRSSTSHPILAGQFHFRPLVSHCSTGLPKTVIMPGSRRLKASRTSCYRLQVIANASFNELEQLAQSRKFISLGVDEEAMTTTDQLYRDNGKVGKMDLERFSPLLEPVHWQVDPVKILGTTTSKAISRVRDRTSNFGSLTNIVCIPLSFASTRTPADTQVPYPPR
jgi:hypothetical protein